jgi:glycosyltransferase involved in cell wall biosynthesis
VSNPIDKPARLGAAYRLAAALPDAREELPLLLRVVVRNTGAAPWPARAPHEVNLSYHWLDPSGQPVDFDGVRARLAGDLPPGAEAELELWVEPPRPAGQYLLAIDLVEEGRAWFSQQGVAWLAMPVAVAPRLDRAPRACIFGPACPINDAVGNLMIHQLRILQARGYDALIMVEHVDERQPATLRRFMQTLTCDDLRAARATPLNARARRFFRAADLFIFHYPLPYTLFDAITLVERGSTLIDYHGMTPPQLWDGRDRQFFVEKAQEQQELFGYADYVLAHSAFARQELLDAGAIDERRIHQMGYVVPLERFRPGPRPAALLRRYGLADNQPLLLYVGRMASNKRVEDLVQALALLRQHLPGAALLLVGDDRSAVYAPVVARVRHLAADLGLAEAVIFAGPVDDAELPAHYQLADVFVTASLHEAFCIPVLEAMACGVPVVGAHTTALPDTIGAAGLTFQPENSADLAAKVLEIVYDRYLGEPVPVDKVLRNLPFRGVEG